MRRLGIATLFSMAACTSADTTPVWESGDPIPRTTIVSQREFKMVFAPATNSKFRLNRFRPEQRRRDPSVNSKDPLTLPQRDTLLMERQIINAKIRASDRGNPQAYGLPRLRVLKARQRSVIRQLRGE